MLKKTSPLTFIVLGGSGDLSTKKLIPAFYNLFKNKKIYNFSIILVSISSISANEVLEKAKAFISDLDVTVWNIFIEAVSFFCMDFHKEEAYRLLKEYVEYVENKNQANRVFYLATMPHHFEVITKNLAKYNIAINGSPLRS